MRDFTIDEVIEEIAKDYPFIEVKVLKGIVKQSLDNIIEIMKDGKGDIRIQFGDIHSIYREVDVRDTFADLDETKILTGIDSQLAKAQEREAKGIHTTRVRGRGKVKRIYNPRHPAYPVHLREYTEGSPGEAHGPLHSGPEVSSNSETPG